MDFFSSIYDSFASFFDWNHMSELLSQPETWGVIGTLIIIEGLLSADNALVLAVMVKHLPKEQQKKALFYGLLGAYVFRFIAIGIGIYLVKITWVSILGGLYLLWIACSNLFDLQFAMARVGGVPLIPYIRRKPKAEDEEEEGSNKGYGFWRTVLAVEMVDIAFSIDSVIAAFGISQEVWVLLLGGMLGVLMMRGVAQIFLKLIEKFPELEKAAFILIIVIGLKMIAFAFGVHVPKALFFSSLIAILGGAVLLSIYRRKKQEAASSAK